MKAQQQCPNEDWPPIFVKIWADIAMERDKEI